MTAKSPQDVLDALGYIVLAYKDPAEYARDLQEGVVSGESINSSIPDDAKVRVVGIATAEDWAEQCRLCAEPFRTPLEAPYVGYLKVIAE